MENKRFAKYLCDLRRKNGITQRQLGHFIGFSDKVISKWETGRSEPELSGLAALAVFFGVSIDDLVNGRTHETAEASEDATLSLLPDTVTVHREREEEETRNLIPRASEVWYGDYFCSWEAQARTVKKHGLTGTWCSELRDALTSGLLFGPSSEYHPLPREYRKGMLFLLDDGWDVPLGTRADPQSLKLFGTLLPDAEKFGDLGKNPTARLRALREKCESLGYAGLGVWVAAEQGGDTPEGTHAFYASVARLHHAAGVRYWKVDWGEHAEESAYRAILTEEVHKNAPGLLVEHCVTQQPLSALNATQDFLPSRRRLTAERTPLSDVFRTYDIVKPFREVCTLGRIDEALTAAAAQGDDLLICAENEAYIAAALGCTLGVMWGSDALYAALRFRRLSPPFSTGRAPYVRSEETLTDTLWFENDVRSWIPSGKREIRESAPAVMARGCPLPRVLPRGGLAPFVAASKNPSTGVYAVAAFRRTQDPNPQLAAPADVTLAVEGAVVTVGVFGIFASLTLSFPEALTGEVTVLAQDMLSDTSFDISGDAVREGNTVTFDGRALRTWGKSSRALYDSTDPALLLRLSVGGRTDACQK